jgi:uncharacterized protein (DUF362 family)
MRFLGPFQLVRKWRKVEPAMSSKDRPTLAAGSFSRRAFVAGAAALGAACGGSAGGDVDIGEDVQVSGDGTATKDVGQDGGSPPSDTVSVGVVHHEDVLTAVRRAVSLAGGLDAILPGQTVFLKPNVVHGFGGNASGIVTTHDMLAAVIQLVLERDPGHVVVGDRSARFFESDSVFEMTGLGEAALAAGADEVFAAPKPSTDPDAWTLVAVPAFEETWAADGGVWVMKRLLEADHIINLPTCKNHRWAGFSLSMKNFIGGVGDGSRDVMHYTEGDADRLSRDIAILNQAFAPTINILDARTALINGGPEGITDDANFSTPGLVLASVDRVALDAVGAAVLQEELAKANIHKPDAVYELMTETPTWSLPQVVHGAERDLGVKTANEVVLHFDSVANADALETRFRNE